MFQDMKRIFTLELVLVIPDLNREIQVEADASNYVIEGVLLVKYEDKRQRPVVFISKLINPTEKNYEIYNKEILVVIKYLEVWRHYLEGTKVQFEIQIDYKNLQYFMSSQKLNYRQVRQILYLSRFDFVLKYIPGKSMRKADRLSRRPDWQKGVENNNEDRTLIKLEWIQKEVRQREEILIEEEGLKERIKKIQKKNKRVVKAVEELKDQG